MPGEEQGPGFPTSGLITAFVLLAGAIVVQQLPFITSRPPADEIPRRHVVAAQDVDARLWQDPFAAVSQHVDEVIRRTRDAVAVPGTPSAFEIDLKRHRAPPDAGKETVVMPVLVPSGSYSEDIEGRRRTRYAVVTALGRRDFRPDDAEHVGFFRPGSGADLPEFIPWERFRRIRGSTEATAASTAKSILVLWLDASAFGREPLGKLVATLGSFGLCNRSRPPIVIIGPAGTDELREMVQDVLDANDGRRRQLKDCLDGTRLYSPFATAIKPDEDVRRRLRRVGITFVPMIGSDRSLMPALRAELARRAAGPELPTHAVALLSELDTGYGREIEETVADGLCSRGEGGQVAEACRERIYAFKYLRGLDGLIPKRVLPKDPGTSEKPREGKPAAPSLEDLERAEGDSQFDYLRRLAARIRREHERIVRYAGMDGFTAIGVFGSDLYDKLLVLQAIRHEFPSAVFFTTDLDARFLHPREFQWTRNLVVASSFGLQLREEIQGAVPPFRNSYQTATFLAVTIALVNEIQQTAVPSEVVEGWFDPSQARIYEIGRTEAVDLSEARLGIQDARHGACDGDLSRCAGIHPEPIFSDRPYPKTLRYWGLAAVSLLGLGLLTSSGMRRGIAESLRWWRSRPILPSAIALLVLALIGSVTFSAVREGPRGEPFRFFEGVSVWPTEIIRIAALVVAIAGIVMCEIRRARTRRALQAQYFEDVIVDDDDGRPRIAELVSVWRRVFAGKPYRRAFRGLSYIDTSELWREYSYQSAPVAHWTRVIVGSSLFFVLGVCIVLALIPPVVPGRGAVARVVDWVLITWLNVPALIVLIFVIGDGIKLCDKFAYCLGAPIPNRWPPSTRRTFGIQEIDQETALDAWIDVRFIAEWTSRMGSVIYYPFVVLLLMIVARSSIFDQWALPISLVAVFLLTFASASALVIILRHAAERIRRVSIERLTMEIVRLEGMTPEPPAVKQLRTVLTEVRELKQGAFAPLAHQPLVRAALLPLSGASGLAIIEYFFLGR